MTEPVASLRAKDLDAADRSVANGELGRACRLFDSAARELVASGAWTRDEHTRRDTLVLRQPWFGFGLEELARAFATRGVTACYTDPDVPLGRVAPDVTAENWRSYNYAGIPLWDVAQYDFCVRHELSLAEIEVSAPDMLDALAAEYGRAIALADRVTRNLDAYTPRTLLVAQGHVMASAVTRALGFARGLRVVSIENTLHAQRLLWDDVTALPVVHSRAQADWFRWRNDAKPEPAERFADEYLRQIRSLKTAQHAAPTCVEPPIAAGGKRIVYLAQVSSDSSVLFGIGTGFARQVDVLRAVAQHATQRGHQLVIKLHPKERDGETPLGTAYDRLTLRQMRDDRVLAPLLETETIFVDSDNAYDTYALIDDADLCITINSQAGLEALIKGKELVCCGRAFYGALGFTHEADDPATLAACMDRVLEESRPRNASSDARRFFHVYLTRTCCDKTPEAVAELVERPESSSSKAPEPATDTFESYDSGERQTALHYDEIRLDHRARYEFAADALASIATEGPCLGLDAFCGNGYGSWLLSERSGAQVTGIDGCGEAIGVAESRYKGANTSYQELRFPFDLPTAHFDFATCFESIEHVEDGPALLSGIAAALRPGGLLFLSTPNEAALPFRENRNFFRFHHRHYERDELLEIAAEAGLAPRLELGQNVYKTVGRRAQGTLPPEEMVLREQFEQPHFLIHVFERLVDVPTPAPQEAARCLSTRGDCLDTLPPESLSSLRVARGFTQLDFAEGRRAIGIWHDALTPGGKLELVVADLRHFATLLAEGSGSSDARRTATAAAMAGLWGQQTPTADNDCAQLAGYDFGTLRATLLQWGFSDVIRVADEPGVLRVVCWKPQALNES